MRQTTMANKATIEHKWYVVDDIRSFERDNYFLKAYPWEYEKEFRIIFITGDSTDQN